MQCPITAYMYKLKLRFINYSYRGRLRIHRRQFVRNMSVKLISVIFTFVSFDYGFRETLNQMCIVCTVVVSSLVVKFLCTSVLWLNFHVFKTCNKIYNLQCIWNMNIVWQCSAYNWSLHSDFVLETTSCSIKLWSCCYWKLSTWKTVYSTKWNIHAEVMLLLLHADVSVTLIDRLST